MCVCVCVCASARVCVRIGLLFLLSPSYLNMTLKSNFLPSVDLFLWYFEEVKKLLWHTYVLEVVLISVNEESVSGVFAALLVRLMTICWPEDWLFCLLICLEEEL